MAVDAVKLMKAEKVFDKMVAFYQQMGIKNFDSDKRKEQGMFVMQFSYTGEDFPMNFHFFVDADRSIIRMMSRQPFKVEAAKMTEMALALTAVNSVMINGKFTLDLRSGNVTFDITLPFLDTEPTEEQLRYMILVSINVVDEYNDQLIMLNKGMTDVQTFLKKVYE